MAGKAKTSTAKKDIDVDKIVKQVTKQVEEKYQSKIAELEEKLNSGKEKYETENKPKSKNLYKFIPDNTKIRLTSNIGGQFIFQEDRAKVRVFFQIDGYGKSTTVSYDELKIFATSKPSFLTKANIAITDVYTDEDITIEDVIRDLKMEDLYYDENKISPIYIDEIFTDKVSDKEFENKVNKSIYMGETILEVSNILYKKGLFSNNTKMNVLRQVFRNPNLFK